MSRKKLLIIGLVWPEPASSAAGTRMVQLTDLFLAADYEVHFASAAAKSEYSAALAEKGVRETAIQLNHHSFNTYLKELAPELVLFDRYVTEEQYGWRVLQECPDAVRILDTEDLHFLRQARQQAVKNGLSPAGSELYTEMAKREIASILRCDLSLIISGTEMQLLQEEFRIDPALLYELPFLEEEPDQMAISSWNGFTKREGFLFIGNYLHEPNWHTLLYLKQHIWPLISKQLPAAEMHIYGSYATAKVMQLHQRKENFLVHGRAADARQAMSAHRVLLAPIQFGAGLKGKFIDAMQSGTPSVTTGIGAEAMHGQLPWNGFIADDKETFAEQAVKLHQEENCWLQARQNGLVLLRTRYGKKRLVPLFLQAVHKLSEELKIHRQRNFMGQLLQHHTMNSSRYMSLWIEEKNKNKLM